MQERPCTSIGARQITAGGEKSSGALHYGISHNCSSIATLKRMNQSRRPVSLSFHLLDCFSGENDSDLLFKIRTKCLLKTSSAAIRLDMVCALLTIAFALYVWPRSLVYFTAKAVINPKLGLL